MGNLQEDFESLQAFDNDIRNALNDSMLSEEEMNKIIHLVHINNYLQIIYSFEIEVLKILLEHFLEVENYVQCASIRDSVKFHNKATGAQIKLI